MATEKRLDLGPLATFVPNKDLPIYNWFYYKEGYSRDLVMLLLDKYAIKGNGRSGNVNVLDPFMGSGTTLVACKERGIDSYGLDVSPLAELASRVKTNEYDYGEIKEAIKKIARSKFHMRDVSDIPADIKRYFNKHTLQDVIFFRGFLKYIKEDFSRETNEFLKLALITTTTRASYMYKDGSVLKIKKKPVPVFRKFYIRTLRKMLSDINKVEFKQCQTFASKGDARNIIIDSEFIDLVITSPPYMNKIEYTKIYGVEEYLFFGRPMEKRGMRAFIGVGSETEVVFPDEGLPTGANTYFNDMRQVLRELRRVCKPGAIIAFIIGDGCFPSVEGRLGQTDQGRQAGMVVHADVLLPRLAKEEGFTTESIHTLNERNCTKNRVEVIGKMEESLIVMRMD